jgi:alginate O-acetyltransferase complex protein AlgI
MLFHTWPFLIFLLVVALGFFGLRRTSLWLPWLALASYSYYGWWNPYYLGLVIYTTGIVFAVAALMDRCPDESDPTDRAVAAAGPRFRNSGNKTLLWVLACATLVLFGLACTVPKPLRPLLAGSGAISLAMAAGAWVRHRGFWFFVGSINALAPLLFFKYARFIIDNLNGLMAHLPFALKLPDPSTLMPFGIAYLLPIGISFFTFQALGYLIDLYLGRIERERNLLRFANFVCFFPILMSGPIERAGHLLPQFRQFPPFRAQNLTDGSSLFLVGLFKKVALAGYFALYVNRVYDRPSAYGAPDLLLATFAFGWQIYFDFSGYTDMARGVAKLLGFDLVLNFNHPYLASSLSDFWRRWHISFSRWILDYIFMPLQMRWRDARAIGTGAALVVTFLVSGIWHGAAWNFIIWGALHGVGLAATYEWERSAFYRKRIPLPVKQAAVFLYVSFTWIFFRADSVSDAWLILRRIVTATWQSPHVPALMLLLAALIWCYQLLYESKFREYLSAGFVRVGLAVGMVVYLFFNSSTGGAFIYFQF